jgi:hypothetical protein
VIAFRKLPGKRYFQPAFVITIDLNYPELLVDNMERSVWLSRLRMALKDWIPATTKFTIFKLPSMNVSPTSLSVHDSFYTVSSRIFAALQFAGDRIATGVMVSAEDGKQWKILDNDVKVGGKVQAILDQKVLDGIHLYELQAINHKIKPEVGQVLTLSIVPD